MQPPQSLGRTAPQPSFQQEDCSGKSVDEGQPALVNPTLCRSTRRVLWRKSPKDEAELRILLADAAHAGEAIHVISTGRNWGFGSYLPPRDDTGVIDLSTWREIGPLDRASLSVRIQPGVTQGQLHDWLQREAPDLAFNITGAGTATSVLGCALERGLGYAGPMDRSIFGLEVMLADGTVIRPDKEWFHPARDHAVGPLHDSLFFQSNYGIVLAARVRLRPRQQTEQAVVINGDLAGILALLEQCYRNGLLTLPTHVSEPGRTGRLTANRLRELRGREVTPEEVRRVFPEHNEHAALAALHGRTRVVNACWRELKSLRPEGVTAWRLDANRAKLLEKIGRFVGLHNHADRLTSLLPLLGLTWGVPHDIGLHSLALSSVMDDADRATEGAIYGNAVSTLRYESVQEVTTLIASCWPNAASTYIVLSAHCLITIYTLHFQETEVAAVKTAERAIAEKLRAAGYPPYRLGINLEGPAASRLRTLVKEALDPQRNLAPGRYEKS